MTRRLLTPLVAATLGLALMSGLAAGTPAASGAAVRPDGLTVQLTQFGSQIAGVVHLSYTFNHKTVRKSCGIYRCLFSVPDGSAVTVKQTARGKNRFAFWRLTIYGGGAKPRVIRKTGFLLVMQYTAKIEAIYRKG